VAQSQDRRAAAEAREIVGLLRSALEMNDGTAL